YETAIGFSADIQRYLSGEQVHAVPPSLGYRLQKAYRKNKASVWVASAFVGLIAGAAVIGVVLAIQARRAEAMARVSEHEAHQQRQEAENNKNAWLEISDVYMEAAIEAEIRSSSARLDADLLEYKADSRVGLLRLARPLKDRFTIPAIGPNFSGTNYITLTGTEFVVLREFQAAAIISAGQEFVPLVPPLAPTISNATSRDERLFLAGNERTGIELLAIPSLKRIEILREGSERLVNWGFSPDSKTCWTQDTDSVVRFWNTDGTLRAKTSLRPERFVYPAGMAMEEVRYVAPFANYVDVKDGVALVQTGTPLKGKSGSSRYDWNSNSDDPQGPTDLYSTRTGQFIRRVELPLRFVKEPHWRRSQFERWIMFIDRREMPGDGWREEAYVIVSADDGREIARLNHPGSVKSLHYSISPSGKWIITYQSDVVEDETRTVAMQLWNTTTWKTVDDDALTAAIAPLLRQRTFDPSFVTDDIVMLGKSGSWDISASVLRLGNPGTVVSFENLGQGNSYSSPMGELGGNLIRCGWVLTDANTFQRLKPPSGRKYAVELARLAPDGRFLEDLDTTTEKRLPIGHNRLINNTVDMASYLNGTNLFEETYQPELRVRPDSRRLTIPPEMLELWAQVVTGGELSTDGQFLQWDEPTWATKQQQLAAMQPPYDDFPFPGWVTQDPHLWWWIQTRYLNGGGKERDRLMDEWRRRSGRTLPDLGPDTWRTPGPAETAATEADPDGTSNTSCTNSTDTQTSQ
ncbi:MAG: hypothetical protein ACKO3T_25045, partial [Planctomycetaceae bacterium]